MSREKRNEIQERGSVKFWLELQLLGGNHNFLFEKLFCRVPLQRLLGLNSARAECIEFVVFW